MRDMGTEMTPVTSQEPSRTATPAGATTPLRSPTSSIPSTPRRGEPTSTPLDHTTDDESQRPTNNRKKELSEQELKLKTRREIVALGVQLGKMNIAAWASKDEKENNTSSVETSNTEEPEQIEYEKRAAAWEEAEKSRHTARFSYDPILRQFVQYCMLIKLCPIFLLLLNAYLNLLGINVKRSKFKHGRVSREQN